jgi:hypothetical protein
LAYPEEGVYAHLKHQAFSELQCISMQTTLFIITTVRTTIPGAFLLFILNLSHHRQVSRNTVLHLSKVEELLSSVHNYKAPGKVEIYLYNEFLQDSQPVLLNMWKALFNSYTALGTILDT